MQLLNHNSIMPFGRYRGRKMSEVSPVYLLWLHDNGCKHPAVKQYCEMHVNQLRQQAKGKRIS